ncbi:MAG: DUF4388 domain-containing protein [Thermodesulfobacteriota bacterium]
MEDRRRSSTRVNYTAHALVSSSSGQTIKAVVHDISLDSVYLHIEPVFRLDEPVNVEIILLGTNSQLSVKMQARVVRKTAHGIAVRFFSPLEWWPIFSYFSSHNLKSVDLGQNSGAAAKFMPIKNLAAFHGDLSVVTIENLMQLVGHASLSGELQLATRDNSAIFFVHEGTLIYGHLEENSMKIGQKLIEKNYITSEQLHQCLSLYQEKSSRPKIGKILVKKGYIQQKDLEKVIKEQIKEIFFEVLSWKEGAFIFSIKKILSSEAIFVDERLDYLILEGLIHRDNVDNQLKSKGAERKS